jgi:hypothetical protein
MSDYTDAELTIAVEAYFKKHSGLARDCVGAALDAVAPAIVARAKAEALREAANLYPARMHLNAQVWLRFLADAIEQGGEALA